VPGFSGQIAGAPVGPSVEDKARVAREARIITALARRCTPLLQGPAVSQACVNWGCRPPYLQYNIPAVEDRNSLYTAFVLGHSGYAAGPAFMKRTVQIGTSLALTAAIGYLVHRGAPDWGRALRVILRGPAVDASGRHPPRPRAPAAARTPLGCVAEPRQAGRLVPEPVFPGVSRGSDPYSCGSRRVSVFHKHCTCAPFFAVPLSERPPSQAAGVSNGTFLASMGPVHILGVVLLNYEGLSLGWMTRIAPPNARGGENT
jgi:hypothetical protein